MSYIQSPTSFIDKVTDVVWQQWFTKLKEHINNPYSKYTTQSNGSTLQLLAGLTYHFLSGEAGGNFTVILPNNPGDGEIQVLHLLTTTTVSVTCVGGTVASPTITATTKFIYIKDDDTWYSTL